MIDFNEMTACQKAGLELVDTLQGDEKAILQHYLSLNTEALLRMASQAKKPFDEVVINALKNGIALGLKLEIINAEVRSKL